MLFNWFSKSVENLKARLERLKDDENYASVSSGFDWWRTFMVNIFRSECQSSSSHKIFKFLRPAASLVTHEARAFQ